MSKSLNIHTSDQPLEYINGKVIFSEQFKHDPLFRKVLPLFLRDQRKAQDLGIYLFFVHGPRSIYKRMSEPDRLKSVLNDGRVVNKDWLKEVLGDQKVQDLIDRYCDLSLTPGQRLYNGMTDNISRYIEELSKTKGSDLLDHIALVEKGKKLYASLKSLELMVREEAEKKTKAGYVPRKFEYRRNAA